jgi:hypothetical protein
MSDPAVTLILGSLMDTTSSFFEFLPHLQYQNWKRQNLTTVTTKFRHIFNVENVAKQENKILNKSDSNEVSTRDPKADNI